MLLISLFFAKKVSALNIVERLWKQIDSQQFKEAFEDKKITKTGWKEIRVFVSSTFSDMHSEREILVKKVYFHVNSLQV